MAAKELAAPAPPTTAPVELLVYRKQDVGILACTLLGQLMEQWGAEMVVVTATESGLEPLRAAPAYCTATPTVPLRVGVKKRA